MGGLLGGSSGAAPTRYAGMQVSTSVQGSVIPYFTGRTRVDMNLVWYGNFQSTGSGSGGKSGGGGPSSYTYSAAWIGVLGFGPLTGVYTVYHDKSAVDLTYENLALALGTVGQAVWSGYPTGTPTVQKIAYSSLGYVATNLYAFGDSPAMPNLTFEAGGCVPEFAAASGMFDSDFAAVLPDYLQSPVHGAGFQGTIATLTGTTNTYQSYCMSLGLVGSLNEDTQRPASDALQDIMTITNSEPVLTCGIMRIAPYADVAVSGTTPDGTNWSYTPNLTPIFSFTDSDYIAAPGEEPVKLARKALKDTFNVINLEVLDRTNQYNTVPVSAPDNDDIAANGVRSADVQQFHQITSPVVGRTVAQLMLQQQLYDLNVWRFSVRATYSLLEKMDPIALTDAAVGLNQKLCRILKVEDDADNVVTIEAVEMSGTSRNAPLYNWASNAGYTANFDAAPGSVQAPAIFQMPSIPGSLSEGITLGIAVCSPTSAAFWGGCQVYCSADGGTTYEWVGTVGNTGPARYGTITSAIGAVTDPDSTTTLPVALANTNLQLSTAVTHAEADANQTLILVGSGATAEVMSYGTGALVSAGHYNLTYLRRGLYGSTNQAHASGAQFVRFDGAIFQLPIDPGAAGATLFFKFLSFNSVGRNVQTLAAATAYSYTVPVSNAISGIATLIPRGSCAISGQTVYKANSGSVGWNSDAYSGPAYSSISISGQFNSGGALGIGLTTIIPVSASIDPGAAATGFLGFYPHSDSGNTLAVENGSALWTGPSPSKNDLYQVTYDGFTVRYYFNGALVATSQHQGLLLFAYTTFFGGGCQFSNVETTVGALATPTQFIATGNCVVNNTNAMKQGGAAAWDSSIYSVTGYQVCHIAAKWNSTSDDLMVGLSQAPAASPSFTNTSFAIQNSGGTYEIYEGGTLIGAFGAVAVADLVAITYDGTNARYYINNLATPVRTSGTFAGLTLYGLCPFNSAGSGLNSLRFGPTTNIAVDDTAQLGANAATAVYTASLSTVNVGFSPTTVAVINVPALTSTATVIATAVFDLNVNTGVFGGNADIFSTFYGSGSATCSITSTQGLLRFTIQCEYAGNIGDAPDIKLVAFSANTSGTALTVSNVLLQVEVVKR